MLPTMYGIGHSTTKTHSFACRETDLERRIISCNDKSTKEARRNPQAIAPSRCRAATVDVAARLCETQETEKAFGGRVGC